MSAYQANHVPKRTRILLVLAIFLIGLYAAAHLATGYVYIPAKRGGILLSGASTLMIVAAQLLVALGCAAKIVDHYDVRQNEHAYQRLIRVSFKASLALFLLAPFAQIVISLFQIFGVDVPSFNGFASKFTFYAPSLRAYESILSIDRPTLLYLGIAAAVFMLIGWLAAKSNIDTTARVPMVLLGAGFVVFAVICMNFAVHDLLVGQTNLGRRSGRQVVDAITDPAMFNAVLLTKFSAVGLILTFGFIAVLGGLIGPSGRQSWQEFWSRFRDR